MSSYVKERLLEEIIHTRSEKSSKFDNVIDKDSYTRIYYILNLAMRNMKQYTLYTCWSKLFLIV